MLSRGGLGSSGSRALPSIEQKTAGMRRLDGYFPLYWDSAAGRLWMEVPRFDTEVLYLTGLASGLGDANLSRSRAGAAHPLPPSSRCGSPCSYIECR